MTPILKVLAALDMSVQELAAELKVNRTTVWRWTLPEPRGTGGYIPRWHHPAIRKVARLRRVSVTPEMLGPAYGR